MSHSQFHSIEAFILRHAWLSLWDKHMTTGRINQVTIVWQLHCPRPLLSGRKPVPTQVTQTFLLAKPSLTTPPIRAQLLARRPALGLESMWTAKGPQLSIIETFLRRCNRTATPKCLRCKTSGRQLVHRLGHQNCLLAATEPARQCFCLFQAQHPSNTLGSTASAPNNTRTHRGGWLLDHVTNLSTAQTNTLLLTYRENR